MRWIAVTLGRRVSRLVLHPITLYFLLFGGTAARASTDYLRRVLGRPPRWGDRYRHVHHFAATILDRVYLLRGDFDLFEVKSSARSTSMPVLQGAAAPSWSARTWAASRPARAGRTAAWALRVAMLMYEHNARLLTARCARSRPSRAARDRPRPHGRCWNCATGSMAAGSPACWRTARCRAPARQRRQRGRSRTHWIDFLGDPAAFNDGAFRLAALLRRPVFFMAGLYLGGGRYECASSRWPTSASAEPAWPQRERRIGAAVRALRALLEAALPRDAAQLVQLLRFLGRQSRPPGRPACEPPSSLTRSHAAPAAAGAGAAMPPRTPGFDLPALMQQLAQVRSGEATFTEERACSNWTRPLRPAAA
jgi:predicted LPLAT superfamily acyltransferase